MIVPGARAGSPGWHEPLPLLGFGLTLTPLRPADATDFLAALGSPAEAGEVLAHLSYGPPADLAETSEIIARAIDDQHRSAYAQRLTDSGELVGTTSYCDIDDRRIDDLGVRRRLPPWARCWRWNETTRAPGTRAGARASW